MHVPSGGTGPMCNFYKTNREAITRLTRAFDRAGWNEPLRDAYPGTLAAKC